MRTLVGWAGLELACTRAAGSERARSRGQRARARAACLYARAAWCAFPPKKLQRRNLHVFRPRKCNVRLLYSPQEVVTQDYSPRDATGTPLLGKRRLFPRRHSAPFKQSNRICYARSRCVSKN